MSDEEVWTTSHSAAALIKIARSRFKGRKKIWWKRKQRLAGCGCYRLVWELLPDEILRTAVAAAEDYADQRCSTFSLDAARAELIHQAHWLKTVYLQGCIELVDQSARISALSADRVNFTQSGEIFRDVFGDPFQPVVFDPSWLTSTAEALAWEMYNARDFSAMPILADALQEAGCESEGILNHCRQPGIHVKGCWLVDHLLTKG